MPTCCLGFRGSAGFASHLAGRHEASACYLARVLNQAATSLAANRQRPPGLRCAASLPAAIQARTVSVVTPNNRATSGVVYQALFLALVQ